MTSSGSFAINLKVRPDLGEIVALAIRLPGRYGDGQPWPPLDAKFRHEDYYQLLSAQEAGMMDDIKKAGGKDVGQDDLQVKHRVLVQAPTTLAALLTSLQMGFRTLAIKKRFSEVRSVLDAAKAEFETGKFGTSWSSSLILRERRPRTQGDEPGPLHVSFREIETLEPANPPALVELVTHELAGTSETSLVLNITFQRVKRLSETIDG